MTRRGSSLVELIISFGIFMAILTATFSILQPGLVAFRTSVQRSDAENEALIALHKLILELQSSDLRVLALLTADGHADSNDPAPNIVFLSGGVGDQMQIDPSAFLILNREVAWFLAPDPQSQNNIALWRREVTIPPVTQGQAPTRLPIAGANSDRVMLRNCQSFLATSPLSPDSEPGNLLRTNPIGIAMTTIVNGRPSLAESAVSMMQNSTLDPQQ